MIPASIASVVILWLYWRRKNEETPHTQGHADIAAIRGELEALNARLDHLQKRLAKPE